MELIPTVSYSENLNDSSSSVRVMLRTGILPSVNLSMASPDWQFMMSSNTPRLNTSGQDDLGLWRVEHCMSKIWSSCELHSVNRCLSRLPPYLILQLSTPSLYSLSVQICKSSTHERLSISPPITVYLAQVSAIWRRASSIIHQFTNLNICCRFMCFDMTIFV